ncbi:PREDICTED: insulin-like growth factor 2 mRNA-binding protein 2 isoform X2 [Priapulus caudatus]|uniref:Insulin-like growth factor 2 mRNA-binding protein 2 isoform X2 n=1 Tax=Priapulus caudatus TaxID=37621 RepID=A0ABM1E9M9_PRICU|nr:PREDICTED: insulin-like growth factor 2 mRNA-binding protein 2 isoform X2 [Priapulus caudatus]
MQKLYIGNLGQDIDEQTLRDLFEEHGIEGESFLVKKGGYAFIDCPDQVNADKAIDKLNGYNLQGSVLVVEPSVSRRGRKSTKVQVRNVPTHVIWEDLERLIANYGTVQRCEQPKATDDDTPSSVIVTYETPEQAQRAVSELNDYQYEGSTLKAELLERTNSNGNGGGGVNGGSKAGNNRRAFRSNQFSGMANNQRNMEYPLRILVPSDMVGAIIGKGGATIRNITQQTRARVDVHRKENSGTLEKAITIFGNPENCTQACKKIMEVMEQEAQNTGKGEVPLKMLAHNNLVGRIIGKGGAQIKKIMQDSDTKITVSSIHDVSSYNMERIITIKGAVESMSHAEAMISSKLRQSFENDMAPQSMMFGGPGMHQMAMMGGAPIGYPGGPGGPRGSPGYPAYEPAAADPYLLQGAGALMPGMFPGGMSSSGGGGGGGGPAHMAQQVETALLYIPNACVGAVIGSKGAHIKNIIRLSGASIKIVTDKDRDRVRIASEEAPDRSGERQVTITGTPESQWKAQYYIFDKVRTEGYFGTEDVRLRVEIMVPTLMVGRIIGKGGQNVREIQRVSGAIVKLPEETQAPQGDEVPVRIIGNFFANQSAQRRIRGVLQNALQQGAVRRGGGGGDRRERGPNQYQNNGP